MYIYLYADSKVTKVKKTLIKNTYIKGEKKKKKHHSKHCIHFTSRLDANLRTFSQTLNIGG